MPTRQTLIFAYVAVVICFVLILVFSAATSTTTPTPTPPVVTQPTPTPPVTTPPVTTPTPPPVVTPPTPTTPRQVVRFNNGTVSGQTYCAGENGLPWGNELPIAWNGAKCISAGFNATGDPTGTACNVIPGQKLGFRVLCEKTGTGWYKPPPLRQTVIKNNGYASGNQYCAGLGGGPWNNELPSDWNGAKCISAGFDGATTGYDCAATPGPRTGMKIICEKTGTGWYGKPQVVTGNNGTVSGQTYCAGQGGRSWWDELPQAWNGAKCISAGFNPTGTPTGVACNVIPGQKLGFRVLCGQTFTGWAK